MYSTLLIINSKEKYSGHAGNFLYNLDFRGKNDVQQIRVNKITIPYSYYNIKEQSFIVNSISYTIPAGNYSIFNLITELQNLVQPNIPSFTVVYNNINNKVTISAAVLLTIDFQFSGSGTLGTALGYFPSEIGPTLSATGDNTINLNLTSNLYISSAALSLCTNSFFIKKTANVIQVVPVNAPSFGYIIWQNNQETRFSVDSRYIQNIDIQVYDDNGETVLFNGQNIIIEIELYSDMPFN